MERIKLSKREKRVLRTLSKQGFGALSEFDFPSVGNLERMGLARVARIEGGGLEGAALTTMGKEYLADNPQLHNPIDWVKVGAIAGIIAAIISFCTLMLACSLVC